MSLSGSTSATPPGQLDRMLDRYVRRTRVGRVLWRVIIFLLGGVIVATGIVLIPLPGPGWVIVFAGLAVLATEFVWARRLLGYGQRVLRTWTAWVAAQSPVVRAGIGAAGLAFVAACFWSYLAWRGVPTWVPQVARTTLVRVPGLH